MGGSLPSDNSEGWHLAVCGLNSLTLSTRPLNPCRGREEQGSARRRTNLLSLMLDISLRITVTQRRERERVVREREEAREGYSHLFNNPDPNLFQNRGGRENVMGRCKHEELVALVPTNRDFSKCNKSM